MSTNDSFAIVAFKVLLSIVSLVIMIPLVNNLTDISFYVTVSVYVLGKFIDLVAKISQRQLKIFFIIYIMGVVVSILACAMCFLGFANVDISNGITNTLAYNVILLSLASLICFVDVADFVLCICKLSYTKRKLRQFNNMSY
ncbi:MAG: hypothetical protein K2K87_14255 [Lachnospiraceae bacterium]|nr:hypothetical protein [Lachnospiraceae bacterium]